MSKFKKGNPSLLLKGKRRNTMKNRFKPLVLVTSSMILLSSMLTGCGGKQAKCDKLIDRLAYAPWSESDSQWYDANCRD